MQTKVDLHVHTTYSNDSVITPKDLIFYAKKSGLNAVAVTDHDRVDGALKIAKETDFPIIPGIEISSLQGHIVGLSVQDPIARGLSADETVDRIHELGGVAIACHPIALFKGSMGKNATGKLDAIETINASSFPFASSTRKANELAEKLELPKTGGTDAHYGPVIGQAFTLIETEPTVESIVKAIVHGQCEPGGRPISWVMRLENQGRFFRKYLKKSE
jgi:hypothetical protein